ncbi:hypothetical protein [Lachnobacterium bovis]|uniref:Winged helix-turn-helix DNA-binding n=1 Tax=Lachnobacterium bovis TaxID=140626 RepID=A0A1H9TNS9_9FIRM|nr:hypothetical protein [Lachnobacterium bovis]SER98761.1 hypothetical protein SAMN02910429_01716 [Lachnobacterium bovis]
MEEKILDYLISAEEPKSISDICMELEISRASALRKINNLVNNGKIIAVGAAKRKYFIANNQGVTAADYDKLKTKSLEILVPAKAASDDAKEEIDALRKEIKNMYANMITIMAVFVAIFSIVFAGGNFLFQSVNETWSIHTLIAFGAAEGGIIIAILIMLWAIKKFLNK